MRMSASGTTSFQQWSSNLSIDAMAAPLRVPQSIARWGASRRSLLRLDVGCGDDLGPAPALRRYEGGEIGRRADLGPGAELGERLADLARGHDRVDGGVELADDLGRRAGGRHYGGPVA